VSSSNAAKLKPTSEGRCGTAGIENPRKVCHLDACTMNEQRETDTCVESKAQAVIMSIGTPVCILRESYSVAYY
jgi:hypothetical protein